MQTDARGTELNVSYVLCIAKQGAIGSTRSFGGTYSRVGERTARFDEARHLLIMLLRNIGQTQTPRGLRFAPADLGAFYLYLRESPDPARRLIVARTSAPPTYFSRAAFEISEKRFLPALTRYLVLPLSVALSCLSARKKRKRDTARGPWRRD